MAKYDELRTLSFEFAPDVSELPYETWALALPENYKRTLLAAMKRLHPKRDRVSLPVGSLNNNIRALVTDVVSVEKNAGKPGVGWLHSRRRVDAVKLYAVISAWVEAEYQKLGELELSRLLEALEPTDLSWRKSRIDLAAWYEGENGTAKPGNGLAFSLLPDQLALHLSEAVYTLGNQSLSFFRTTGGATGGYAELVSWPPIPVVNRRKKGDSNAPEHWLYSFVIRVNVRTLPTNAKPRSYIHLGTKRWVSGRQLYLPAGHNTSIYLKTSVPWIEGFGTKNTFAVARAGYFKGQRRWADNLTDILAKLSAKSEVFDIERLSNPREALRIEAEPNMAVVHHHEMGKHGIATGIPPRDRKQLAEQIASALEPGFSFSAAPKRIKATSSLFVNPKSILRTERKGRKEKKEGRTNPKQPFTAADYRELRRRVARSAGKEIQLELWTQTEEIEQALLKEISTVLGLPIGNTKEQTLSSPELCVRLHRHDLGALGDAFKSW